MADTHRDGVTGTSHHLDTTTTSRHPSTNKPFHRQTRSQRNVPDLILHPPLSRSPLKDARKARPKARGTSPVSPSGPQQHTEALKSPSVSGEVAVGMSLATETGSQETIPGAEPEEISHCGDGRGRKHSEEQEGSEDSLFAGTGRDKDLNSHQRPGSSKKRASPDTDAIRAPSSPGVERESKRAKVEEFQVLGRRKEYSEYHEPLRNADSSPPGPSRGYKRASSSSSRPTSSPCKGAFSRFTRAQSVPLCEENELRVIDFTSIPPSPRRSPSKSTIEIRRALSVPPPDEELMDVDVDDPSALLHFTNSTQTTTPPLKKPVFCYAVNFATPRGSATPLSPLTPLPSSPATELPPGMQNLLAQKANAKLRTFIRRDSRPRTSGPRATADATDSVDVFQSATHVPSPGASTFCQGSTVSGPSLTEPSLSSSMESMQCLTPSKKEYGFDGTVGMAAGSVQSQDTSQGDPSDGGCPRTNTSTGLSPAPSSGPKSNALISSRVSVIAAMKSKRGPFAPQGPRRVTRSVSMKEGRAKGERTDVEDVTVEEPVATTSTTGLSSHSIAMPPPSSMVMPKPRPPKSMGALASKPKLPVSTPRSTSLSKPALDSRLRQTSLETFVTAKPAAGGATTTNGLTASTSTAAGGPSRVAPSSSPSKIPLPASPAKRPSMTQHATPKPFLFSLGPTSTGTGAGTSRGISGRSLSNLSHALDKLAAPPPSRPNTSMGFVRGEGRNDDGTPENSKGKGKAKDDASLPLASSAQGARTTFARPTASSLKRAATITELGLTTTARIRGRGGAVMGGSGRGKGAGGIFGRMGEKASKKTTLPVVIGSPVKGSGATDDLDGDGGKSRADVGVAGDEDVFGSRDAAMQDISAELLAGGNDSRAVEKPMAANASSGADVDPTSSPISVGKGKQRAAPLSTLNPASSALHALSESLSSLPQTPTPPKARAVGTRTGLRSSTAHDGSGVAGPSEVHGSGGAGSSSGMVVNGSGGVKKATLKILNKCAIFVDVRTEQGDDAGGLFVDMLKGLGAKIMGRLGRKCTHIVYKNGLPKTLMRYRMLDDPKPLVIGIAWVVECVERRARVDEEKFKIDVDMINVAGGNRKRRRSMLPKYLIPASPGPDFETPVNMSSEADEEDEGAGAMNCSLSQDPDLSIRSKDADDLPPLERARRRRSVLPGGQTRLFP